MTSQQQSAQVREEAARWYDQHISAHRDFTTQVARLLEDFLSRSGVPVEAVASRTKTRDSFLAKCVKPAPDDPTALKYDAPWQQITDVSGIRVTTLLLDTVPLIEGVIRSKFLTKGRELRTGVDDPTVPGYLSVHYLVELPEDYLDWSGHEAFRGLKAEIQIRTVLQHAWAQIQHDILYKEVSGPRSPAIERRLRGLAGMLELADKEFDAIRDELEQAREAAPEEDDTDLDLTSDPVIDAPVLRAYLSKRFSGARDSSPVWLDAMTDLLGQLQLRTLSRLEQVVDDASVDVTAVRGQLAVDGHEPTAVELLDGVLRAALGDAYLERRASRDGGLGGAARGRAAEALRAFQDAVRARA